MNGEERKNKKDEQLHEAVAEKTLTYILVGLGFVTALAWNDAIQGLFNAVFGSARASLSAKFGYAFMITAIVTFISLRLGKDIGPKQ